MNVEDPKDKLGHKFKLINNAFNRALNSSLAKLDITGAQSFLLGYIERRRNSPPCQHDIEMGFNIKHPTATGILKRLSDKGYVTFQPDENDRRLKRIIPTELGIQASESVKSSLDSVEDEFSSVLTPEELKTLNAILDKLIVKAQELYETKERKNAND